MNRISQLFKKSIVNKFILLIFLIVMSVGGILTVNIVSLFDVKYSLDLIIDRDVKQVIENVIVNNKLRNYIASSDLIIHTFTEHENTLKEDKERLNDALNSDIESLKRDEIKPTIKQFIQKTNELFDQCVLLNGIFKRINTIETSLDTELANLDEIVVEKELSIAFKDSEETRSLNQLAIMLPGYREIFFEIILEFVNAKNAYLHNKSLKNNHDQKILSLLEEFEVGLNAMPIAWQEIIPYVRNLMAFTSSYKFEIIKAFESMKAFHDQFGFLIILQKQMLDKTSQVNNQITENTQAVRTKVSKNITKSIGTTVLFSGFIILILLVLGTLSLKLVHPIKKLSIGTEKIGAGDLNHRVNINSTDEIGHLAESFNQMAHHLSKTTVSKEFFQNILKSMKESLFVLTPEGNIKTVNQASCDLLGYTLEELVGEPVEKIFDEIELKKISQKQIDQKSEIEKSVSQQLIKNKEKTILDKAGKELTVLFSAAAMLDKIGGIQGIVCVASDISDLKIAKSALKVSEANYRHLFNAEPDPIIITDAETKQIVDVNPAALKLYGYGYDEICGIEAITLSAEPENSAAHIRQILSEDSSGGSAKVVERLHKDKKGNVFPVEISHGFYIRNDRKMICAIMRDISKRKQIENELSAEKNRLAITLRSIGDGVISTDLHGKIISVNKVAEELTGWNEEEAIGRPLGDVFHIINEFNRKPCKDPVRKVLETGGIVGLANNTLLISKNGKEYVIADSASPIKEFQNKIIGAVLVFRDITEKRKIETELVKAQKLESLGVLAGGIAHDFNNFLTAIIGNMSLAKLDAEPGDRVLSRLNEMEKASLQAKNLTQQLLIFSKGGEPIKELVTLADLVKSSANFSLRGSKVRCDFSITDDLLPVEVDEGQIGQVINNLVLNADHAMPEGGIIKVCVDSIILATDNEFGLPAGPYLMTSFQDHGVGIPPDHLAKVFDPYFTTKHKGSGLGLTVAYSIIDKHNGRLTVESELGQGTIFTIYLPASEKQASKAADEEKRIFIGKGKILVMDDEEFVRDIAIQMLNKMGYDVSVAIDGNEAIEIYMQAQKSGEPFDAVIMDLTIPGGMGGKEAIRKLKKLDPNVKAFVSSGYSNDPVMSNFRDYGFEGVVKKPYRIQDMSDALRSFYGDEKSKGSAVMKFHETSGQGKSKAGPHLS